MTTKDKSQYDKLTKVDNQGLLKLTLVGYGGNRHLDHYDNQGSADDGHIWVRDLWFTARHRNAATMLYYVTITLVLQLLVNNDSLLA